jgi:hypothetical protein
MRHATCMEKMRNPYKISVRKSEWNQSLGRSMNRWGDNIKMNIKRNWFGRCGLDSSGSG